MPFTIGKFPNLPKIPQEGAEKAQSFMNIFMRRSFHRSSIVSFSRLRHRITSDVAKRIPHWQIFDSPPPIWVVDFFVIKQLVSQPCPRFCIAGLGAWRRNQGCKTFRNLEPGSSNAIFEFQEFEMQFLEANFFCLKWNEKLFLPNYCLA